MTATVVDVTDLLSTLDSSPVLCWCAGSASSGNDGATWVQLCPDDQPAEWRAQYAGSLDWRLVCTPCVERHQAHGNVLQKERLP